MWSCKKQHLSLRNESRCEVMLQHHQTSGGSVFLVSPTQQSTSLLPIFCLNIQCWCKYWLHSVATAEKRHHPRMNWFPYKRRFHPAAQSAIDQAQFLFIFSWRNEEITAQRNERRPLCNRTTGRGIDFHGHYPQVTAEILQWKRRRTPLMKEEGKVKRESDRNKGKTIILSIRSVSDRTRPLTNKTRCSTH